MAVTPTPPSLAESEAAAAAHARLDAAFPTSTPGEPAPGVTPPAAPAVPGAPAETAPPEIDLFSDEGIESLIREDMPYRDGKALREQVTKVRNEMRPFRDAFGDLDESQREMLLNAAPELGSDMATIAGVMATVHPADRQFFLDAAALMVTDPMAGAEMLARGAEMIRQSQGVAVTPPAAPVPGTDPMPGWAAPEGDPNEAPMTRADFEREMATREQQRALADEVNQHERQILARARELGYDPDAAIGSAERDRYAMLLSLAQQPDIGFDIDKANARLDVINQAAIDAFVAGKSNDATRPAAPAAAGVAPVETQPLETMTDGQTAMRARLAAALGPDARRRSSED